MALTFSVDESLAGMGAIGARPAPTIFVVAVITHTHGIHGEVSVFTVSDLTLFTASFPSSDATRFWAGAWVGASCRVVAAEASSRASLCHLSCFDAAFFRAYFWIRAKLDAWWTDAPSGTGLTGGTSQLSAIFLAGSRVRTDLSFDAYAALRARFCRSFTLDRGLIRLDCLRLGRLEWFRNPVGISS